MFSDRLKSLRTAESLTQAELAARFRVTQQAVARWERGSASPEPGIVAKLAAFFRVSADYLLGGEDTPPFPLVKIIGAVKAGYDGFAVEEALGRSPADVRDAEGYRYLLVRGDSMEPYIREGDLALVHLQPTLNNGDLGVILYGDGEATLKRYRRMGDTVRLEPFNRAYDAVELAGEDLAGLRIFGKVVETKTRW
ncbi:MAG: LexA family transcriptional regulator [Firmicutes bacterium]|nr:LexA family transcriptional regulator [Bacillota bacterium]